MKKITTEVSEECWTELKIIALRKKITLLAAAAEILEKAMSKKIKSNGEIVEE